MKLKAAQIFEEYVGEIYDDYSGRGMYGKTTTGIQVENENELFEAIADIMIECDEEERNIVSKALRKLKKDSLGLNIIYY